MNSSRPQGCAGWSHCMAELAAVTDHTVKSFDEQLRRLKQLVEGMGKLTGEQLKAAIEAIERSDTAVARRVIEREPDADRMQHEIDRLSIRLLALRQPLAIDLRDVLSAQRIASTALKRVNARIAAVSM
ncbi:MAG: PhoU domain-containing protein [Hyphomicrobiaceae bacterium]